MIKLPDMTYDEAEALWPETDYASEATHQDENPIHGPDAAAFFLEGYLYARKLVRDMQRFRPLPAANAAGQARAVASRPEPACSPSDSGGEPC